MRLAALCFLLAAATAHADTPDELVARWLAAQNRGDFAAYQALYAESFTGVRNSGGKAVSLDRAGWLADRARMFKKPMVVEAREVKSRTVPEGTRVELEQIWQSGDFKDVGPKTMLLVPGPAGLLIAREELLSSKRVLLPGQVAELVLPARTSEEATAASERFAERIGEVKGIDAWPLEVGPRGVVIARCVSDDFEAMLAIAQAVEARVTMRVVRGAGKQCPTLVRGSDPDESWEWPEVAVARVGKRAVTVLVSRYDSSDLGDFGRHRIGFHVLAWYRDEKGVVLDTLKAESASDFSELDSVAEDGRKVVVEETYIDAPCDGTSRHGYKKKTRTLSIEPDPKVPDKLRQRSKDSVVERGRCDDTAYRQWVDEMNRAR